MPEQLLQHDAIEGARRNFLKQLVLLGTGNEQRMMMDIPFVSLVLYFLQSLCYIGREEMKESISRW